MTGPSIQKRLAVYREYMALPYVMGKDLIEAGFRPDRDFTETLAYARNSRDDM